MGSGFRRGMKACVLFHLSGLLSRESFEATGVSDRLISLNSRVLFQVTENTISGNTITAE